MEKLQIEIKKVNLTKSVFTQMQFANYDQFLASEKLGYVNIEGKPRMALVKLTDGYYRYYLDWETYSGQMRRRVGWSKSSGASYRYIERDFDRYKEAKAICELNHIYL